MTLRVGSTFSGIGGFDLGLEHVGMTVAWQVEIDRFCNRVLARRYPDVRREGDITKCDPAELGPVDVLVGGFPCQDLSVAGQRAGLAGERSGLFYEFLRFADQLAPRWLVIENVAGLLSSVSPVSASGGSDPDLFDAHDYHNGEDFAVLLGELTGFRPAVPRDGWRSGGVCVGPKRTAAWRLFDSQYFGVAQRRRRVFVVCGPGDAGARALLADAEGGGGDPPSRRAPREGAAGPAGDGAARPLLAKRGHRMNATDDNYLAAPAHALRARPNLAGREDAETFVAGPVSGGDYGGGRDGTNDYPNLAGPHVEAQAFAWQQGSDAKGGRRGRSWVARAGNYAGALSTTRHDAVAITPADEDVARPLTSSMRKHHDEDTDTLVARPIQDGASGRDKDQNGAGVGADGDPMYTLDKGSDHAVAYSMRHDAERDGVAKTPSADAEGRVRLRDAGLGVYEEIAPTLDAGKPHSVAHTLRGEGFDASEDGTGRGTPLVVDGPAHALTERHDVSEDGTGRGTPIVVEPTIIRTTGDYADPGVQVEEGGKPMLAANPMSDREMAVFEPRYYSRDNKIGGKPGDLTGPLRSEDHAGDSAPHVFRKSRRAQSNTDDETWVDGEVANTLNQFDGGDARATELAVASSVRRLTPTECERLQGFPDGWTCLEVDEGPDGVFRFADGRPYSIFDCRCPDGPRYAACGNAVTVDVISSIGRRILAVEAELA